MTSWIGDGTLAHLRDVAEWPDVGDRYEITGRLGRGGMGVVYAAQDRTLDREVAIKVLDSAGADAARRLQEEARILARLEHPGIVPIHDAGTLADGRVFYVMKLVRGARLDRALDSESTTVERLDVFTRICGSGVVRARAGHRASRSDAGQRDDRAVRRSARPRLGRGAQPGARRRPGGWSSERRVSCRPSRPADRRRPPTSGPTSTRSARSSKRCCRRRCRVPWRRLPPRRVRPDVEGRYPTVESLSLDILRFRHGDPVEAYRESLLERGARVYRRYRVPILLVLAYMVMRALLIVWLGV